ncbi:M17 family metallopeptidase [Sporosarcina sp. HYO08]|uniref:leucyl aminopeptidase family protein n=1 Tax=Sporosarcina sp. HYO08 TaxID=1759557 RepID=UPI00079C4E64|nr:leucyl aminopeptidase family protein [Sporosarcina sp. HYO08]KXH87038.1 aminopeptidase [Sporosarcina sp. HYO08]
MTNEVKIIFANDLLIADNEAYRQFIAQQKTEHCTVLIEDAQYVVVKEIEKQNLEKVRTVAGNIARDVKAQKIAKASIEADRLGSAFSNLSQDEVVTAFVEGWELGAYEFVIYKSNAESYKTNLEVNGDVEAAVEAGEIRAAATAFSRDLMNEVPNVLNPQTFPEMLSSHFEGTNVAVEIFDFEKLGQLEMNGLLTVGRGSKYPPAFVELHYEGDASKPLVALVGKGVTFDTGGISLKSGRDLSDMRFDMGGAAAVAGAMSLLAASKAKANVVALIPIAENIPDSKSVLPGEVIRYKNGLTVQVGNTDAEGRLILADALIRAGELNATYIVDIATLTGAIVNALGTEIGGVFGDEELSGIMKKVGDDNGDFVWPMPLIEAYDASLASDYADMNNISSLSTAGSITAALFLRRFVPEQAKWLHVDMAGMMDKQKTAGYYQKAATGYGARLLADFTTQVSK